MKNKHIRVVCLKNDKGSPQHHHSGLIIPQNQELEAKERQLPPSLAYLSSRLQQNKQSMQEHSPSFHPNFKNGSNSLGSLDMSNTKSKEINDTLPTIEKYVADQKSFTDNKKSTIRHMMGSIDFGEDKKRQRKVAKTLKRTIQGLSLTQPVIKSKKQKEKGKGNGQQSSTKYSKNVENRTFLQQDFQTFLQNKKQEERKSKEPKPDLEELKLKRLCLVNPQREQEVREVPKINYFSFQTSSKKKLVPSTSDKEKYAGIARARLQQKIFKMQLNLGEEEFDWSKFKSKKRFTFQTVGQ